MSHYYVFITIIGFFLFLKTLFQSIKSRGGWRMSDAAAVNHRDFSDVPFCLCNLLTSQPSHVYFLYRRKKIVQTYFKLNDFFFLMKTMVRKLLYFVIYFFSLFFLDKKYNENAVLMSVYLNRIYCILFKFPNDQKKHALKCIKSTTHVCQPLASQVSKIISAGSCFPDRIFDFFSF